MVSELDEGLVTVGADVALGVDDLAEGAPQLGQLLIGALPRQVPDVYHLGRRLGVPELRVPPGSHPRSPESSSAFSIQPQHLPRLTDSLRMELTA